MQLSEVQMEAMTTTEGQVILISCPGSGKTSTVVRRVQYMVEHGIPAGQILVLTFSKAAAMEMQGRYKKLAGKESEGGVHFATIHSFCYNVVAPAYRLTSRSILRESEAWMIVRKGLSSLKQLGKLQMDIRDYTEFTNSCLREISVVNNNGADWDSYKAETCPTRDFRLIYEMYEQQKYNMGKIDFDDMLKLCYQLFNEQPGTLEYYRSQFRYIIVDEYQDTNFLQRDILYMLAGGPKEANLCVVGDDDQSIYKFRGARPEIMLKFAEAYPDCRQLYMDVNYRSEPCIVDAARRLIEHNHTRFKKDIRPFKTGQGVVSTMPYKTHGEEIAGTAATIKKLKEKDGIPYEDMAVLYRNNRQASLLCIVLMAEKIPFHTNDPVISPYKHWIYNDLLAYYRLANGRGDGHDVIQVINKPNRFVPVEALKNVSPTLEDVMGRIRRINIDPWKKSKMSMDVADFFQDLSLLKSNDPATFIGMVRSMVGYDSYLKSYAQYRNMDLTELTDMLESYIADIRANSITTMDGWMAYAQKVNMEIDAVNSRKAKVGVAVSTCHRSKGLEWPAVFIIGANEGTMPSEKSVNSGNLEEERRLFYVAATRAKERLTVSYVQNDKASKSRFVSELTGETVSPQKKTKARFRKGQRVSSQSFGPGTVVSATADVAAVKFDKDPCIRKIKKDSITHLG